MEAGWDALAAYPLCAGGTPGTGLAINSTRAGGLGAASSLFGEKILSATGVSCPGSNPTARRCLGDLPSALQDSQHLPCMEKHPAAACTGQVPRHAQPHPCPPVTRRQPDSGPRAGAISDGLGAMLLPRRGQPHACGWAAPCCAEPAAKGQTAAGLAKIHLGAHKVNF